MAGIALFECEDSHTETAGGGGMGVDSLNAGDAELVQVIPDARGADDGKETALLIGRIIRHKGVGQDRVIAMMDRSDFDQRTTGLGPPVVAGKFAEGTFVLHGVWFDDAFNDKFGVRG